MGKSQEHSGCELIEEMLQTSNDDLWSWDQEKRESLQLEVIKKRFASLRPLVKQLDKLATLQDVDNLNELEEVAPLLFQHTVYKSYPISLIEKGRFDMLTRWLDGLTAHDLSGVDATGCLGFDDWFDVIEAQTDLVPNHSTGTTGKLSIIPRDKLENSRFERMLVSRGGFGDEPNRFELLCSDGSPVPIVYPSYRYGRHVAQRMLNGLVRAIGSEETTYVLYDELFSADVASLVGRVRGATMRGELDELEIDPELMERFKSTMQRQETGEKDQKALLDRILNDLKGRKVYVFGVVPLLFKWAEIGEQLGLDHIFAPGSIVASGGGLKGVELPDDWKSRIENFLGLEIGTGYGMSENMSSPATCPEGKYHPTPFTAPFVLDVETGEPLPRTGTQTGRYAFFDLLLNPSGVDLSQETKSR